VNRPTCSRRPVLLSDHHQASGGRIPSLLLQWSRCVACRPGCVSCQRTGCGRSSRPSGSATSRHVTLVALSTACRKTPATAGVFPSSRILSRPGGWMAHAPPVGRHRQRPPNPWRWSPVEPSSRSTGWSRRPGVIFPMFMAARSRRCRATHQGPVPTKNIFSPNQHMHFAIFEVERDGSGPDHRGLGNRPTEKPARLVESIRNRR
jgi:hypothetical protein